METDDDRDLTADELNRDWAVAKLQGLAGQRGGKPFFMGVGFIRPHTPIIVPQRFFDMFPLESVKLPVIKPGDVEDTFLHTVSGTDQGDLDRGAKIYQSLVASYGSKEEALRRFIQAYLAAVAADDEHIGKMLDVIDNSSLRDNTIIILTGDHGWQMGQKDYVYKNSLWEESTRVPLIIRVPGVTNGGATSYPVSLVDLYPTLIDLCGLDRRHPQEREGPPAGWPQHEALPPRPRRREVGRPRCRPDHALPLGRDLQPRPSRATRYARKTGATFATATAGKNSTIM